MYILVIVFILFNSLLVSSLTLDELLLLEKTNANLNVPDYKFLNETLNNKPNFVYISSNGEIIGIELKNNSNYKLTFPKIQFNETDNIPNEILIMRSNFSMITTGSFSKKLNEKVITNNQTEMVILNELVQFKNWYFPHASIYYNQSLSEYYIDNYLMVGVTYQTFYKGPHYSPFSITYIEKNGLGRKQPNILNFNTGILINASLENYQSFKTVHNKLTNNYYVLVEDTNFYQYIIGFDVNKLSLSTYELSNDLLFETMAISEYGGKLIIAGFEDGTSELNVFSFNRDTLESTLLFSKPYSPDYFIKSENSRYFLFYSHSNSSITIYDLVTDEVQDVILSSEINEILNVKKPDSVYSTYHWGMDINSNTFIGLKKEFIGHQNFDEFILKSSPKMKNWLKVFIPLVSVSFICILIISILFIKKRKNFKRQEDELNFNFNIIDVDDDNIYTTSSKLIKNI